MWNQKYVAKCQEVTGKVIANLMRAWFGNQRKRWRTMILANKKVEL